MHTAQASRPPVSVVVPVLGAARGPGLAEAVAGILGPSRAAEVTVVDNLSEVPITVPAGVELVRALARLSTGAARNLGLRRALPGLGAARSAAICGVRPLVGGAPGVRPGAARAGLR